MRIFLDLQRRYGNRHVRRVMAFAMAPEDTLAHAIKIDLAAVPDRSGKQALEGGVQANTPRLPGFPVHLAPEKQPRRVTAARQDVAVIVGRPSQTIESRETSKDKIDMQSWRAAARALAPKVYEGLTLDKAFAGLRTLKVPIGKLYIISHAGPRGISEVTPEGYSHIPTLEDMTSRLKAATRTLGSRAPRSIEMLSCSAGASPKTMASIGKALGATTVRAPVQETFIWGETFRQPRAKKTVRLTKAKLAKIPDAELISHIEEQLDALRLYEFVPGVPHPQPAPSETEKLKGLVRVLRKTGMIPYVSYNAPAGEKDAVPYWKAPVERKKPGEKIPTIESLGMRGVVEVTLPSASK